jgi:hypothetical protein
VFCQDGVWLVSGDMPSGGAIRMRSDFVWRRQQAVTIRNVNEHRQSKTSGDPVAKGQVEHRGQAKVNPFSTHHRSKMTQTAQTRRLSSILVISSGSLDVATLSRCRPKFCAILMAADIRVTEAPIAVEVG